MLNKQGPGKIDWTDYTWNPIAGKCHHNCSYCYMHRFWRLGDNGTCKIKENYLKDKFPKTPSKIFVGSSTDMWGEWVPGEWISKVILAAYGNREHTFQFLTKNPLRYAKYDECLPGNGWYGTTYDGMGHTQDNIMHLINSVPYNLKFVSFEPLIASPVHAIPLIRDLQWIIIGADSTRGAKKPPKEWADYLIQTAREFNIPVFVKDNYGYTERIKEIPE